MRDGDNCLQDGSPVYLCNYLYRCVSFMSDMCVCLFVFVSVHAGKWLCVCLCNCLWVCVCDYKKQIMFAASPDNCSKDQPVRWGESVKYRDGSSLPKISY